MDSSEFSRPPGFLRLPRELRDIIYEYALVRDVIEIESAVTKAPKSRLAVGSEIGFCDALYSRFPLTYPLCNRSNWQISLDLLAIPESHFQLDSSKVHMTYQYSRRHRIRCDQKPALELFLVCNQVYNEAKEVFYAKNVFYFNSGFQIPAVAAFLRDRPLSSLALIRSISLQLWEVVFDVDKRVLQHAYSAFEEVCQMMASPQMKVRRLFLSIKTTLPTPRHESRSLEPDELAFWTRPLLWVKDLEYISVLWRPNDAPAINNIIGETVVQMREHMIKKRSRHIATASNSMKRLDFVWRNGASEVDTFAYYPGDSKTDDIKIKCTGRWTEARKWFRAFEEQPVIQQTMDDMSYFPMLCFELKH